MKEIIIIYAFLPLLSNVIKKVSHTNVLISISIILLITTVHFFSNRIGLHIHGLGFITSKLMYISYVIAGYYFAVSSSYYNKFNHLLLFFAIVFFAIVGYQIYSYHYITPYNVWYTNPLHYLVSLSLFYILLKYDWKKDNIACYIEMISKISFAIYLLHIPVMKILLSIIPSIKSIAITNVIILHFVTFTICIIIILMLSKVRMIRKYIFYIK